MRLWTVTRRAPLEAGETIVRLWSWLTYARTEEAAIRRVKFYAGASSGRWTVEEAPADRVVPLPYRIVRPTKKEIESRNMRYTRASSC